MKLLVGLLVTLAFGQGAVSQEEELNPEQRAALERIEREVKALAGPADESERLLEIVAGTRQEWGPQDPVTLQVMRLVGRQLQEAGRYAEARDLREAVVETRLRMSGAEHPDTLTALADLAETLYAQGDYDAARQRFETVVEARTRLFGAEHLDTLTALGDLGATLYAQGDYDAARQRFETVVEAQTRLLGVEHPDTLTALANLAAALYALGDFNVAKQRFETVVAAQTRLLGADHPSTLMTLANLAGTLRALGDFEAARQQEETVVEARTRVLGADHPDTLTALGNLAVTLYAQGDYEAARQRFEMVAEGLTRVLGADHPSTLMAQANVAGALKAQGDYDAARQRGEAVVEARTRLLGPEHPDTLIALENLAETLGVLGDLEAARRRFETVVEARTRLLGVEHPDTLIALENLAATLRAQGDYDAARQREETVVEVRTRLLGADHLDTLRAQANLAGTLGAQGDFGAARQRLETVVEGFTRLLGADHPSTLMTRANLAALLRVQGDLDAARQRFETVVEGLTRVLGAEHPDTLLTQAHLAATLKAQGDLNGARRLLEQVVEPRRTGLGRNRYPTILREFSLLASLAKVYRDLGQLDLAAERYLAALTALEAQTRAVAASEEKRSNFKAQYEPTYKDTLATLLTLGRIHAAHHVLERSRAQGFLSLLAERDVVPAQMPPDLRERLDELDREYDRTVYVRDRLDPNQQHKAFQAILAKQEELRRQRERLKAELRERAPEAADLQYPQPLTVEQIRPLLEPGTLMLSYAVGPETTYLFTLSREEDMAVHVLDVEEATLAKQAADFFAALQNPERTASATEMAAWLYRKLLAPAAEQIAGSERLLILPDGPLFQIPFAALLGPDGKYLIESKAVHSAVSATVYGQLKNRRRTPPPDRPVHIAAFGNPSYPSAAVEASEVLHRAVERSIFDGGLDPLPYTEREVRDIAGLYNARPYLGPEASEEAAKALDQSFNIIHFAAHGLSDPITPLDSFIALSITNNPDKENGLLQAWEIYERMRLDADLVVLSACRTAFGPEQAGEGLQSLTRAFQVAGARTVVASLWNVNDASTAELMIRFYRHLRGDGDSPARTTDEALRAAQLELLRGEMTFTDSEGNERDYSSPHYWAAFQVIGDWK